MNLQTQTSPEFKSIRSWPEKERPRERLLERGPGGLSEAELVAILLGHGTRGRDAVSLARDLIARFGGLRPLFAAGASDLCRVHGLGKAKAAAIAAAAELSRRALLQNALNKDVIREPQSVLDYLYGSLRDRKIEIFKVLLLNKANCMLAALDLFQGTVDEAAVHPREIVKAALEHFASAVILVHNHPSGRVEPSPEDRKITGKIAAACETVSIRVLDHIIIGDNRYFSFREAGLL